MLLNCGVGEESWESLGLQGEIHTVHSKGDQSCMFIGTTDAEAETPILWPPDVKSWLIWKDPDAGKDWGQEKKGTTEDEMAGWHHRLDGHGLGWTPGVGDGQGGLVCCGSWVAKSWTRLSDWTEVGQPKAHTCNTHSPANVAQTLELCCHNFLKSRIASTSKAWLCIFFFPVWPTSQSGLIYNLEGSVHSGNTDPFS